MEAQQQWNPTPNSWPTLATTLTPPTRNQSLSSNFHIGIGGISNLKLENLTADDCAEVLETISESSEDTLHQLLNLGCSVVSDVEAIHQRGNTQEASAEPVAVTVNLSDQDAMLGLAEFKALCRDRGISRTDASAFRRSARLRQYSKTYRREVKVRTGRPYARPRNAPTSQARTTHAVAAAAPITRPNASPAPESALVFGRRPSLFMNGLVPTYVEDDDTDMLSENWMQDSTIGTRPVE